MSRDTYTVLVLAGGDSPERDVSLSSAKGIAKALREAGHRVLVADPARPDLTPSEDDDAFFKDAHIAEAPPDVEDDPYAARAEFTRVLTGYRAYGIDAVFNGLHGGAGEDGTLQAVLEYLGIPFTGSGSAASALAMDKYRSKQLAATAGVPVAPGLRIEKSALAAGALEQQVREVIGLPAVVKPNAQGSSVGLSIVDRFADIDAAAARAFRVDDAVLIERFVPGREITQAVLEEKPDLPLLEIRPESGVYDYKHKYQSGKSSYLVPAPVDDNVASAVRESARRTFDALGLSVYARVDFRLDPDGNHYLLEANTLPGMTATSLVPKSAQAVGIDYNELCDRILRLSLRG